MRERGRYQIQLMKTRSSSGVGQKIDLEFDVDSLRIRDLGEDDDDAPVTSSSSSSNILNNLKRNSGTVVEKEDPSDGATVGKIRAEADSTALRGFLSNLGE
jgi:hypothetical protein